MRNKVGGVDINTMLVIGAGVAAYFIIKNVLPTGPGSALNNLGLSSDPACAAVITAQQNLPPSQNPFSYQFGPLVDFYNDNTPSITASSAPSGILSSFEYDLGYGDNTPVVTTSPTMQQFFQAVYASPPSASPWALLDVVALSSMAQSLNAFFGTSSNATSVFSQFSNQLQVAFVAAYTFYNYNRDLVSYLVGTGGLLTGLPQCTVASIITAVNALPVNPSV